MKTWAAILLSTFLLSLAPLCFAQDASGEFAKAMDAYKTYDYEKSCRRMNNFYEASRGFHAIPEDAVESMKSSGKNDSYYTMAAQQAENARDPGKACTEHFLAALYFAINDNWSREEKSKQLALSRREKMLEMIDPGNARSNHGTDAVQPGSSMSDVVEAAKANTSGSCATDQMMMRDKSLIPTCVNHLMTNARKQKAAKQWTIARINYSRAAQVNKMLGAKQDAAVARETARAIREIDAARNAAR